MKQDTLEGKAKTKNGVKRLCFSIICILLEVIFIITIVTRLNEYAEVINLFTRILSGILVLGLYASNKTSSIICAFGLAAAAPRSPERCLELCGIALPLNV